MDEQLVNVIYNALSSNVESRFQSAEEFIKALNGETTVEDVRGKETATNGGERQKPIQVQTYCYLSMDGNVRLPWRSQHNTRMCSSRRELRPYN